MSVPAEYSGLTCFLEIILREVNRPSHPNWDYAECLLCGVWDKWISPENNINLSDVNQGGRSYRKCHTNTVDSDFKKCVCKMSAVIVEDYKATLFMFLGLSVCLI